MKERERESIKNIFETKQILNLEVDCLNVMYQYFKSFPLLLLNQQTFLMID